MANFRKTLQDEITRLERELSADPRYQQLTEAKRLLALYTSSANLSVASAPLAEGSPPKSERLMSGVSSQALAEAKRLLAGRITPTRTSDILNYLNANGIRFGGENPQNTLSSLLSKARDDFKPHGRSGWTLTLSPEANMERADDDLL